MHWIKKNFKSKQNIKKIKYPIMNETIEINYLDCIDCDRALEFQNWNKFVCPFLYFYDFGHRKTEIHFYIYVKKIQKSIDGNSTFNDCALLARVAFLPSRKRFNIMAFKAWCDNWKINKINYMRIKRIREKTKEKETER